MTAGGSMEEDYYDDDDETTADGTRKRKGKGGFDIKEVEMMMGQKASKWESEMMLR